MTAQHLSSSPALVGREHERAALTDAITRAEAGEPSITTIVGEPGIGKTKLADEVARIARRRGVTVVRGASVTSTPPVSTSPAAQRACATTAGCA